MGMPNLIHIIGLIVKAVLLNGWIFPVGVVAINKNGLRSTGLPCLV